MEIGGGTGHFQIKEVRITIMDILSNASQATAFKRNINNIHKINPVYMNNITNRIIILIIKNVSSYCVSE